MTMPPDDAACAYDPQAALSPEERRRFQDPAVIRRMLDEVKSIAVVGLSRDFRKPSHYVSAYLQKAGYRIMPVTPHECVVLGESAVPSLSRLPVPADLALIFRPG